MKTPYFTIIMPTHRRAALLRRSLGSLRSNDFKDFQIILVADETDAADIDRQSRASSERHSSREREVRSTATERARH